MYHTLGSNCYDVLKFYKSLTMNGIKRTFKCVLVSNGFDTTHTHTQIHSAASRYYSCYLKYNVKSVYSSR